MASGKSTYWDNKILDALFRQVALPGISNVYAALMTTSPGAGNTGVELSIAGYARVAVPTNTSNWPAASAGQVSNTLQITFPVVTGAGPSGTVVSIAFYDASTSGNLLYWCDLASQYQKTYSANDQPIIPAAAFTATEA